MEDRELEQKEFRKKIRSSFIKFMAFNTGCFLAGYVAVTLLKKKG